MTTEHASLFLEDEARTLERRYRPCRSDHKSMVFPETPSESCTDHIAERCQKFDISQDLQNMLEEEQEKELSPEMQEERQIERPPHAKPAKHKLHPDVIKFVSDGVLTKDSKGYMLAFSSLCNISDATSFDVQQLVGDGQVLVTMDFTRTISTANTTGPFVSDAYLRSVQWILTLTRPSVHCPARPALIISPFEAQCLMPLLRKSSAAILHIYKPHWNILQPALNRLDFFCYPPSGATRKPSPSSMAQLDLFAGRTHFSQLDEYEDTCKFLGLTSSTTDRSLATLSDGFILDPTYRDRVSPLLQKSPVAFVKGLTRIRTNYRDFAKTHIGKVLSGVLLTERDIKGQTLWCHERTL